MADKSALEAAAAAGVIRAEQVGPLFDFLNARAAPAGVRPGAGEEELRFIRNFHDVFLAIGIALFACGLGVAIVTFVTSTFAGDADPRQAVTTSGVLTALAGAVMWGLGEFFARRRRLFLPAIAIVIAFTVFAVIATACLYFGLVLGRDVNVEFEGGMPPLVRTGILLAMSVCFLAPLAFYARFRLPFSLGLAGAGVALFVIVAALTFNAETTVRFIAALYLILGVLLFLAGVAFDARDPARNSRFSDNGFWLHLAAAPFILNGSLGLVGALFSGDQAQAMSPSAGLLLADVGGAGRALPQAVATLGVVAVLGILSLLINRRALIVSALLITGVAIGIILNEFGLGAGALAAATLITLGAFVLVLGAGWHGLRRALLGWVRPNGIWARVFPPETPATA